MYTGAMQTIYSKRAARIAGGYVILIVVLLVISGMVSDSEGRIFDYLVIGFPWFWVVMNDSIWGTLLFVTLNSLTVYFVALLFVEAFKTRDLSGLERPEAKTRFAHFSNAKIRFQSSFMLITIQPLLFASAIKASEKVPT
jgi:hypothetical protein